MGVSEIPGKCPYLNPSISQERSLDFLLEKHAEEIKDLKEKASHIDAELDDIALLRYVLSFKNNSKAVQAIKTAVDWRKRHSELLASVAEGNPLPHNEKISKYLVQNLHKKTKTGAPLQIIRSGLSNPRALMDVIDPEELSLWFLLQKELGFQLCDIETRKTGYLVKMVVVLDFNHGSPLRGNDKRFFKVLGGSSQLSEQLHPQLLEKTIMCNLSWALQSMFNVVKIFMSKKFIEKTSICPGKTAKDSLGKCNWASDWIDPESLPTFLGGNCTCDGKGCINNIPNDQTSPVM